jgi:hypothetical protein
MAAPSTAITRLDLSVSYGEFSLVNNLRKFVGLYMMPMLGVAQEAADFLKVTSGNLIGKVQDTLRAPKASYKRNSYNFTKDSYALAEHGLEEVVDDALIERYGDLLKAEMIASRRLVHAILLKLEYDIATALTDTAVFTGAKAQAVTAGVWTTAANCDPIADVDAAREKVHANCNEEPNILQLTRKSYRLAIRSARVESLLKYDASEVLMALMDPLKNSKLIAQVNSGLCDLFQVEKIVVARGNKNTADEGQTASFGTIWNDAYAMLARVSDDGMDGDLESPEPQLGRTLFSTKNSEPLPGANDAGEGSLIMEEYREENVRGGVLRARNKRKVHTFDSNCGCLITGIV